MLHMLADVLMVATGQNPMRPHHPTHRPDQLAEDHRRRVWSLISGIRF